MHLRGFFCCQNYHAATTGDVNGARGMIYLASSRAGGWGGLPSSKRPCAGGRHGHLSPRAVSYRPNCVTGWAGPSQDGPKCRVRELCPSALRAL